MTGAPFELAIKRSIAAPPAVVWQVWTERLAEWWAPKPWTTEIIERDLRPGGRSTMIMRGPDGGTSEGDGVFLEVVQHGSIVFTDAFRVDWIPQKSFMTGLFDFAPNGDGTRHRAGARHWDEAALTSHAEMGFTAGWGIVADQLAALAEAAARG